MRHQLGEGGVYKSEGVRFWPYESYGNSILQPKKFDLPSAAVAVAAGKYHSVFLTSCFACASRPGSCIHNRGLQAQVQGSAARRHHWQAQRNPNALPRPRNANHLRRPPHSPPNLQTLLISSIASGNLYGFGVNDAGSINGVHKAEDSIEFTPCKIEVPCRGKIVRIKASNGRSMAFTDRGEVWYWGGLTYGESNKRLRVEGFHLLNEEQDVRKSGETIVDYDSGLAHEILLTQSPLPT